MVDERDRMRRTGGNGSVGRRGGARGRLLMLFLAALLVGGVGNLAAAGQKKEGRRGDAPGVRKGQRQNPASHPSAREDIPARKDPPRRAPPRRVVEEAPRSRPAARPEAARRREPHPRPDVRIIETPRREGRVRDVPAPATPEKGNTSLSPRRPGAGKEDRVRGTLDRFRRDWVRGDSRALSGMLSKRGRIRISIESSGIHDSFGRGQAQYVLQEYFASTRSRQLAFSRLRVSTSDGESAYGMGKMKIRDRETGKIRERTVFVSMAPEDGGWAIREIRITD